MRKSRFENREMWGATILKSLLSVFFTSLRLSAVNVLKLQRAAPTALG